MINLNDPKHRQRLAKAVAHGYQQHQVDAQRRSSTIKAYLGMVPSPGSWGWMYETETYKRKLPKGNLLQLGALNFQIALAYGEPQFLVKARTPEYAGLAEDLSHAINRMAMLLNLGKTVRRVAADSFFGYGIFKTGLGELPKSAQQATGQRWGPCIWGVSQPNYLYDIGADDWDNVDYVGDIYSRGLDEARAMFPGQEDRLEPRDRNDVEQLRHLVAKPDRFETAEEKVWFVELFIPSANVIGVWPFRDTSFADINEPPLITIPYTGHWSGIYRPLGHIYTPDELAPVAMAESSKSLHFLFQDLFGRTADQALRAKINPLYRQGSDRDMRRAYSTEDREPVGVGNPKDFRSDEMGYFEIPGPSQSQTGFLAAVVNMFKMLNPFADDPATDSTATGKQLQRDTTNAFVAEARRKLHRELQLVGYQLGTLLLNDQHIVLPSSAPLLPGSDIMVDRTWRPGPRQTKRIDDFDISINPYSLPLRTPEQKLAVLTALSDRFVAMAAQRAQGAPINLEATMKTFAEYSGCPEIRDWFEEIDPLYQARKTNSLPAPPKPGAGHYVRENVSEKSNAGALVENLSQNVSETGQAPRFQ